MVHKVQTDYMCNVINPTSVEEEEERSVLYDTQGIKLLGLFLYPIPVFHALMCSSLYMLFLFPS
jgi:hypothetical protein